MQYTNTLIVAQGKREKRNAVLKTYAEDKSKELIGLAQIRKKRATNNIREKRSGKNYLSMNS